jgi:hypothetical protein
MLSVNICKGMCPQVMVVSLVTSLPSTQAIKTQRGQQTFIKGPCELCSHYHNCPRMRGENICYGKKELLPEPLLDGENYITLNKKEKK